MIGKLIGAAVGAQAAKKSKKLGGTTGAVLGAAVPFVLRRISIPTMLVMGAGGYAAKKMLDKKDDEGSKPKLPKSSTRTASTKPAGAAPITGTGSVIDSTPGTKNSVGKTGAATTTAN